MVICYVVSLPLPHLIFLHLSFLSLYILVIFSTLSPVLLYHLSDYPLSLQFPPSLPLSALQLECEGVNKEQRKLCPGNVGSYFHPPQARSFPSGLSLWATFFSRAVYVDPGQDYNIKWWDDVYLISYASWVMFTWIIYGTTSDKRTKQSTNIIYGICMLFFFLVKCTGKMLGWERWTGS